MATAKSGGPKNGMDSRYGIHDAEIVDAYGYSWPEGVDNEKGLLGDEYRVNEVMHQVGVEKQNQLIAQNPKVIADGKAYADGVVGATNTVLGR